MEKRCQQCGKVFDAKLDRAKFCSGSCRALSSQGVAPVTALPTAPPTSTGLLDSVVKRVTDAGLLGTVDGEAAIDLASRMVGAADSSYSAMHRQLVVVLERLDALAPVRSSLDELRLRRDRKRGRSA